MAGEHKGLNRRSSSQARRASRELLSATEGIEAPINRSERSGGSEAMASSSRKKRQDGFEDRAKARYTGKNEGRRSVSEKTHMRLPQVVFTVVLLAALVSVGLFTWDRWFRFDDIRDFRGQWVLAGSTTPVVIDARAIKLAPEVDYFYTLDIWSKTVSYTFGDLKGSGKYRFSPDRKKLVIIEEGSDDWLLYAKIAVGLSPAEEGVPSEGTTILVRDGGSMTGILNPISPQEEITADGQPSDEGPIEGETVSNESGDGGDGSIPDGEEAAGSAGEA